MTTFPTHSFIEFIAERLGQSFNPKFVFAEPIEKDGVIIIPVARIRYGFGGGYKHKKPDRIARGGGGGGKAEPVGYIEIKNGQTLFKPIHKSLSCPSVILALGFAGLLLLKGLTRLLRKR